jgi:hypothetical protein
MNPQSTLTLGRVKASSVVNISGNCSNSAEFTNQLNEAVQRLMDYGEWFATVSKARFCIYQNCITWPRWVGTVLAVNLCNNTRPVQGGWYEWMPLSASDCMNTTKWTSNVAVVDDGLTPVFNNIPCGSSNYVRAYARKQADIGKTVTIYGIDANGQEYMTKDAFGDWQQGEVLTLAAPYVETASPLREVTLVKKELTVGPVDLFQYDPTTALLHDMAYYEPSETDPMYRHSTVKGGLCCASSYNSCSTGTSRKVDARIKLQFIPAILDTDVIQIDNIPAIKLMIQAIRLEEAGDDDTANKKQAMAIKELNRQLRNKYPLDQIPIDVRACGTALPRLHGIGMIQ